MTLNEVLLNILLGLLGAFFALWYSDLGSPRLKLYLKDPKDIIFGDGEPARSLTIFVKNEPRKGIPFISRQTAYSCHGNISFYNQQDMNRIGNPMAIRWSGNPQPIRFEYVNGEQKPLPEPNLLRTSQYIDIPRDEQEEMDVAVRFSTDSDAYGWNSESHLRSGRHQDYKLPKGNYVFDVTIITSHNSITEKFLLINPNNVTDFKIEKIESDPGSKLIGAFKKRIGYIRLKGG